MKLIAKNIACERGGHVVFSGLSFNLQEGDSLSLAGKNGTGKTSLLRLICGLVAHTEGDIELISGDEDLTIGQQSYYCAHSEGIKYSLTVQENIEFWASIFGGDINKALKSFTMSSLRDIPSGYLSAGQKKRLSLSRLGLAFRPIWLLDEPSVNIDNDSRLILAKLMEEHVSNGGILIASTHAELNFKFSHKLELKKRSKNIVATKV